MTDTDDTDLLNYFCQWWEAQWAAGEKVPFPDAGDVSRFITWRQGRL